MLSLAFFVLAILLPSGPAGCGHGPSVVTVRADTGAAPDTIPLRLTSDLLTRMTQLSAELRTFSGQLTAYAHDSAYFAHFYLKAGAMAGLPPDPTSKGDLVAVLDVGAIAAKVPAVAGAFQRAQVAPAVYLPFVQALANAEATDTMQFAIEGLTDDLAPPVDSTLMLFQNLQFVQAHRPAIAALGIALPKTVVGLSFNDGAGLLHFLDTTARPRARLRTVIDPDDGRVQIGFLDSTEAPADAAAGAHPPPLRVLFVGNSLTYFNAMPKLFSALAAQGLHRRVVVGLVSVPGASPFMLWMGTDVARVITALPWDAVVVQLKPTGSTTQLMFLRFVHLFTQAATAQHAQAIFWTEYPSLITTGRAQRQRDDALAAATRAAGAVIAPIPAAWDAVQDADYNTWATLLGGDGVHPSPVGSYLIAMVVYRTLTGQSPVGLPHQVGAATTPDSVAEVLQRAAAAATVGHP